MSPLRERFFLIVVVNLVLTTLVVAGALTWFRPSQKSAPPTSLSAVEAAIAGLESRLGASENKWRMREMELTDRIAELERASRTATAAGSAPESTDPAADDEVASPAPSPEAALAKGIGAMMKTMAKRQRDRYIDEIMNPTDESRKRQQRQLSRMANDVSGRLDLDANQKSEVERILKEVDDRRRQAFRDLVLSKQSPDDVTYEEVKTVLDDSFEEEDRMIEQTLPADKSKEYKETAQPFRQMVYIGSQSAFPSKEE